MKRSETKELGVAVVCTNDHQVAYVSNPDALSLGLYSRVVMATMLSRQMVEEQRNVIKLFGNESQHSFLAGLYSMFGHYSLNFIMDFYDI